MRMPPLGVVASRMLFSLFFLVAASYCLLAYIPFTYRQMVAGSLFPWLTAFPRLFPYLYWVALVLAAVTAPTDLRRPSTRYPSIAFLIFFGLAGVPLCLLSPLSSLKNDGTSLVWSLLALLPILWLATIDVLGSWKQLAWADPGEGGGHRAFYAACLSGLFLAPLYTAITLVRCSLGWAVEPLTNVWFLSLEWTVVCHLLLFVVLYLVWDFVVALSRLFRTPAKAEFLALLCVAMLLLPGGITVAVFLPLSFTGPRAALLSVALAACLVSMAASISMRLYRPKGGPIESGLDLLTSPIRPLQSASTTSQACFFLLIPGLAYFLATESAAMDWGYMAQESAVIVVWTLTFAALYTMLPPSWKPQSQVAVYGLAVVVFGGYVSLLLGAHAFPTAREEPGRGVTDTLGEYANLDVSFRIGRDILSRSPAAGLPRSRRGNRLYAFLAANTDIPRSVQINPVPVNLVTHLAPSQGFRPNIFIFVVDSLRRDYVSTYNPAVTFTPSLDSFGRDSVVMKNAFTQYGGTALSEPCIWAGAFLLHQEYTTPFYPMNSLEKLLETDRYTSYISKDNVLRVTLDSSQPTVQLDQGVGTMDLDLCRTTRELESKLGQPRDNSRPIFAYTQPQNIHISVINRQGRSVPAGEKYPGFDPAVASRLARIDKCFGQFVAFLKRAALYDGSIIIVTADHGDSLGEGGRMGHAYYIYPEIVRVPLIIHLPDRLRKALSYDPTSLAFLTDITPSLYYLLGHRPIASNRIYGRPLFTMDPAEQSRYARDWYLLASSYGPVWGILGGGELLYIADGVSYNDYLFDATAGPAGTPRSFDDSTRAEYRRKIVDGVLATDRYYGFTSPTPAP